jgi:hypothetical protein
MITLIAIGAFRSLALGQSAVYGRVVGGGENNPLAGVEVHLVSKSLRPPVHMVAKTSPDGRFKFDNVFPGNDYEVSIYSVSGRLLDASPRFVLPKDTVFYLDPDLDVAPIKGASQRAFGAIAMPVKDREGDRAAPAPIPVFIPVVSAASRGVTVVREESHDLANGRYYALVIGINNYPSPMHELKTAVADAEAVSSILSDRYGFEVKLLVNADATHTRILEAIRNYKKTLKENDNLLIYYAGHGYLEGDKAFWLPSDADAVDSPNRIIADELTTDMRIMPARHVLLISDSCYSGALTREVDPVLSDAEQKRFLDRMLTDRSRTLMASGGSEPVADNGPDGHSIFAYAVLRALAKDDLSMFTASDLFYQWIRQQVAGRSDQVPQYNFIKSSGHDGGDFVFVRKAAN